MLHLWYVEHHFYPGSQDDERQFPTLYLMQSNADILCLQNREMSPEYYRVDKGTPRLRSNSAV